MKLLMLVLLFIVSTNIFPQIQVKQITFNDSLSRNVSFYFNENYISYVPYILYEVYSGTSVNIYNMFYDSAEDSFIPLPPVTNSAFQNKNPVGIISGDTQYVFYQTNKNGNWDIVYKHSISSGWSDEMTLLATPEDEEKPEFVQNGNVSPTINMICRQGDKILFLQFGSGSVVQEVVFSGSQYGEDFNYDASADLDAYYVAVTENLGADSRIVYKYRPFSSTEWSEPVQITSPGKYNNPVWYPSFFQTSIFYSKVTDGEEKIFQQDLASGEGVLFDELAAGGQTRLAISPLNVITELLELEYFYGSYTYRLQIEDSTFVRVPDNEFFQTLSFYTKVDDINPGTGFVGYDGYRGVIYCMWEDSTENSIQLFGKAVRVSLGDVDDHNLLKGFILDQNYPNPFNPATRISYYIPQYSKVLIKVFDVLGNEITTLVNEEKPAGTYEITWNAYDYPSGVYFYQLRSAAYVETKKMILMK